MYNHISDDYVCPICLAVQGTQNEATWITQADIFYRDDVVMGFISSKFVEGNEGHPLIVPLAHAEHLYDLPTATGHRIFDVAKKVALALKQARSCAGVTVLQNNEPAGDQHAFHYHLHVFPRFDGDRFHEALSHPRISNPSERVAYADALRAAL